MSESDFNWNEIDPSITKTSKGMQVNAPVVSVPSTNEFKNTNPALTSAFQQADEAWFEKTGQHIPVTSAARSREKQKEIFERSKKGEKGIYMPVNPDDHPEKEMFHTDALDIPENIPESHLNKYGIHRPLGKADPVHATLMPTAKQNETPTSDFDWSSVINDNTNNQTTSSIGKNIVPKGGLESFVSGAKTGGEQSLIGIPQLVSQIPAQFGYNAPRNWLNKQSTEIAQENEPYRIEHPGYNLSGEIVGATPSALMPVGDIQTGSSVLRLMGQGAAGGGMAGAMQGTPNVENPLDYWLKKAEQFGGGVIGGALTAPIAYGASKVLGYGANKAGEAWDWMRSKTNPTVSTGAVTGATSDLAKQAVEASDKAGLSNETKQIIAEAPSSIQEKIVKDVNAGKVLNETAVGLHAKDQSLPKPLSLTDAQATKDAGLVSEERENRGTNGFNAHQGHQTLQARENIDHFINETAPLVQDSGHFSTGEEQIKSIASQADSLKSAISSAYNKVKDLNGGNFPIDVYELNANIKAALQTETGRLKAYEKDSGVLGEIKSDIDDAIKNHHMTFETYETLRSDLADIMRSDANSRIKGAARIIRNELENLPMGNATAEIKEAADKARTLARYEKSMEEKTIGSGVNERPNPLYNKIYDDFKSGKLKPDTFNSNYIIKSNKEHLASYIDLIKDDPKAIQEMQAGVLNHLRNESTKSGNGFSATTYNKILKNLEDNKKLDLIFPPEMIKKLKNFGEVADAAFNLPVGHHVSTSGTGSSLRKFFTQQQQENKQGSENAGNLVAGAIDLATQLPIASTVNKLSKNAEATAASMAEKERNRLKYEFGAGMSGDTMRKQLLTKTLPKVATKTAVYGVGANMFPATSNVITKLSDIGKE
jgi:hypothetical protein